MTVLRTDDMHCEKCVERITKALNAADFNFEVSLADKTVSVDATGEKLAEVKEIMDDLGFDVVEV